MKTQRKVRGRVVKQNLLTGKSVCNMQSRGGGGQLVVTRGQEK